MGAEIDRVWTEEQLSRLEENRQSFIARGRLASLRSQDARGPTAPCIRTRSRGIVGAAILLNEENMMRGAQVAVHWLHQTSN